MSYAPPSGGSLALEFIGAGYEPPHGAAVNLDFTHVADGSAPIFMVGVSGFTAGAPSANLMFRQLQAVGDDFSEIGAALAFVMQRLQAQGSDFALLPERDWSPSFGLHMRVLRGGVPIDYELLLGGHDAGGLGQPSVINRLRQVFPLMAEGMEDIGRPIVGLP